MKKNLLKIILLAAKYFGLFAISRALTSGKLRILCYHGVAIRDEYRYKPTLFLRAETFSERMEYLAAGGYPVLSLTDALRGMDSGNLPKCPVVITIDDGWYGTFKHMFPVLNRHQFPATLYVSSYYVGNQIQVPNIAADYAFKISGVSTLDISRVAHELEGTYDLKDGDQCERAFWKVVDFANTIDAADRQQVFRRLCDALLVNWQDIERLRICAFVNKQELEEMYAQGMDLQLHSHRHRFAKCTFDQAKREIDENRQFVAQISEQPLEHFCYPSGDYTSEQCEWLRKFSVRSATTTQNGLNDRSASRLELARFVDSESISSLEFEAELCGFFDLVRLSGIHI